MSIGVTKPARKPFIRSLTPETEKKLDSLIVYLESQGLHFYDLAERNMGDQRYVDVKVSIKLS
jgi:predicted phosphatase